VAKQHELQRPVQVESVDIEQLSGDSAAPHRCGAAGVWDELGGLSEDFFLFGEEADLTVRALRADIQVATTDLVEVNHDIGSTTGATADVRAKSGTTLRHAARSAVVFSRKHNVYRTPVVVGCRTALAALVLLRQGPGPAREVCRGIVSGLRAALTSPPSMGG